MAFARLPPFLSPMKVLRLLCGIFLPLLSSRGTVPPPVVNAVPILQGTVSTSDKCWIFMHLQKCGGSTVKGILEERFPPRYAIYDSVQWKQGGGYLQSYGQNLVGGGSWNVIAGGYPEALRRVSAVDEKCQWFTLFRHPISRMVSAYYYCQELPLDTACASEILNARDVDLVTFAKHWGNFAMRQFALSLVPVDDVLEYSRTDAARDRLPPGFEGIEKVAGWYLLKMYLDDQAGTSEYVEIPDVAMYEMLQPVQDLLRDRYTVGILEEFDTTLSLFDVALSMPGVDWHRQYVGEGDINVDHQFAEQKAAALDEAWTNSEIKKYMQLDLVLYEHAVDVFHEQARAYGLE
ncbi:unnamed protein product [Laminaria digitata]